MTWLAVVADVHVGNFAFGAGAVEAGLNARCRATLGTLRRAGEVAQEHDARLVVAGDLFHVKRPEPAVIAAVQAALWDRWGGLGPRPVLLLGNHDAIGPGDSALAPLRPVAQVVEAATDLGGSGVLYVPWSPAPALGRLDAALAALDEMDAQVQALVMHCGLYDATFPPWLRGDGAIKVGALTERMLAHGVQLALAGDYHQHREWNVRGGLNGQPAHFVVQVGALCPTGFADDGLDGYGSVLVVDTVTGAWERIEVPGPRFVRFRHDDGGAEAALGALAVLGHAPHARLVCPVGAEPDAEAHAARLRAAGYPCDVAPEGAEPEAPGVAPAPVDWAEALRAYVGQMALGEGVDRAAVLDRAEGYTR